MVLRGARSAVLEPGRPGCYLCWLGVGTQPAPRDGEAFRFCRSWLRTGSDSSQPNPTLCIRQPLSAGRCVLLLVVCVESWSTVGADRGVKTVARSKTQQVIDDVTAQIASG